MAVSVSKAGPYYTGTSSISFSSLRSNFRAQVKRTSSGGSESFNSDTSSISASDLLRITSTSNTNPVVPNATENANIVTSQSNWSASHFRNSIKFYYVILPSGDTVENFDIDSQSWNSNLNKNVNKIMFIDGTCGSTNVTNSAATFNATAHNFTIDVSGSILGAGGKGGGRTGAPAISGQDGGDALSVTSSSGNNVVVNVKSGAQIYGGGGGGEKGKTGSNGSSATCKRSQYFQQACQQGSFIQCPSGWNQTSSGQNCCEWKRGCYANNWWRWCEETISTSTPQGGAGGNGGNGRGYNNPPNIVGIFSFDISRLGGTGGPQSCPSCPGGYSQSGGSCSSAGDDGGLGGDWGSDGGNTTNTGNGGDSGDAINGSNYSVTGTITTSTVKGDYNP